MEKHQFQNFSEYLRAVAEASKTGAIPDPRLVPVKNDPTNNLTINEAKIALTAVKRKIASHRH
jgi:hypothetical protein